MATKKSSSKDAQESSDFNDKLRNTHLIFEDSNGYDMTVELSHYENDDGTPACTVTIIDGATGNDLTINDDMRSILAKILEDPFKFIPSI